MSRTAAPYLTANAIAVRLPDGTSLLNDLTLSIADERIGLVGANGSGKSTLLAVLAGTVAPTSGRVHHAASMAYLSQQPTRDPGTTVAHLLGIADTLAAIERTLSGHGSLDDLHTIGDEWDAPDRARAVLGQLRLDHLALHQPVSQLSGGEASSVRLAALLLRAPRVLLLDEPTNHLDRTRRDAVYELVAEWPYGLLTASHDRSLLSHVDRIIELTPPTAQHYGGNFAAYFAQREQERAAAESALESAAAALSRTKDRLIEVHQRKARSDARGRRERDTGSQPPLVLNAARERSESTTARMQRTSARLVESAQDRVQSARARIDRREPLRIAVPPTGLHAGALVFSARQVTVSHTPDAPPLFTVHVDVRGADRVAVVGENGSGKSTLLRLLNGDIVPSAGSLYRGLPVERVAMLDQHTLLLDDEAAPLEAYRRRHGDATDAEAHRVLAQFHVRGDDVRRAVKTLSGGERVRVALACILGAPAPPQCLLLDEPTNHLDFDSVRQLVVALREYDGAIIVASHDESVLTELEVRQHIVLRHAMVRHAMMRR